MSDFCQTGNKCPLLYRILQQTGAFKSFKQNTENINPVRVYSVQKNCVYVPKDVHFGAEQRYLHLGIVCVIVNSSTLFFSKRVCVTLDRLIIVLAFRNITSWYYQYHYRVRSSF